jgi:hypothetical protein
MDERRTQQASVRQTGQVVIQQAPRSQAGAREQPTHPGHGTIRSSWQRTTRALAGDPSRQAFWVLRTVFTVAPVVAGLDKFFQLLVDWDKYLAPAVSNLVGGHSHAFMLAVGVVEIAAGIGVAIWTRVFAYVVSAWLLGIVVNLLLIPGYYDIALRDFGLAVGALALGRLSEVHAQVRAGTNGADGTPADRRVTP